MSSHQYKRIDVKNDEWDTLRLWEDTQAGSWVWSWRGRCGGAHTRDEALLWAGWHIGRIRLGQRIRTVLPAPGEDGSSE